MEGRLIIEGKQRGALNMSIDAVLFKSARQGTDFLPVLRFYEWASPTLSLGFSQDLTDIDLATCTESGVEIVRRPTGGRAVFHEEELTYSLLLPKTHFISNESLLESYKVISEGFIDGFNELGVEAKLSPGTGGTYKNPSCFASATRYEVTIDDKKVIGSAQRRAKGAMLQQGSILLNDNYLKIYDIVSPDKRVSELKSISLEAAGYNSIDRCRLIRAFTEALAERLEIDFQASSWTPDEADQFTDLVTRGRYSIDYEV